MMQYSQKEMTKANRNYTFSYNSIFSNQTGYEERASKSFYGIIYSVSTPQSNIHIFLFYSDLLLNFTLYKSRQRYANLQSNQTRIKGTYGARVCRLRSADSAHRRGFV